MLLERASVYAGVQAYPLFTMSRKPRAISRGGIDALSMDESGGARRDRTDDLLLAKQALSQLSYGPDPDGSHQRKAIQHRPNTRTWWAWEDLNFRPHAYQARALTS